jgi:ABC-type molybdate transport system substrate-binding protein
MKTMTKLTALVLVCVMLLACLVSCGSAFGKIKKNFEDAGYTYQSEDANGDSTAKTITAELEEGNLDCTVHVFKGEGAFGVPVYAMVLEFKSDKELAKAFAEEGSETLKGLIKDAQNSEYVRDNCVLVALTITQQDEMKGIFNQ